MPLADSPIAGQYKMYFFFRRNAQWHCKQLSCCRCIHRFSPIDSDVKASVKPGFVLSPDPDITCNPPNIVVFKWPSHRADLNGGRHWRFYVCGFLLTCNWISTFGSYLAEGRLDHNAVVGNLDVVEGIGEKTFERIRRAVANDDWKKRPSIGIGVVHRDAKLRERSRMREIPSGGDGISRARDPQILRANGQPLEARRGGFGMSPDFRFYAGCGDQPICNHNSVTGCRGEAVDHDGLAAPGLPNRRPMRTCCHGCGRR